MVTESNVVRKRPGRPRERDPVKRRDESILLRLSVHELSVLETAAGLLETKQVGFSRNALILNWILEGSTQVINTHGTEEQKETARELRYRIDKLKGKAVNPEEEAHFKSLLDAAEAGAELSPIAAPMKQRARVSKDTVTPDTTLAPPAIHKPIFKTAPADYEPSETNTTGSPSTTAAPGAIDLHAFSALDRKTVEALGLDFDTLKLIASLQAAKPR